MQSTKSGSALWAPRFLGIMRIVVGLLFLQHGLAKLFGWPHVAAFDNIHAFQLLWFAGIIETVGSVLLTIGLFTRCAAFVMSGEMAVAYFMVAAPRGFFPILNKRGERDPLLFHLLLLLLGRLRRLQHRQHAGLAAIAMRERAAHMGVTAVVRPAHDRSA